MTNAIICNSIYDVIEKGKFIVVDSRKHSNSKVKVFVLGIYTNLAEAHKAVDYYNSYFHNVALVYDSTL